MFSSRTQRELHRNIVVRDGFSCDDPTEWCSVGFVRDEVWDGRLFLSPHQRSWLQSALDIARRGSSTNVSRHERSSNLKTNVKHLRQSPSSKPWLFFEWVDHSCNGQSFSWRIVCWMGFVSSWSLGGMRIFWLTRTKENLKNSIRG